MEFSNGTSERFVFALDGAVRYGKRIEAHREGHALTLLTTVQAQYLCMCASDCDL